MDFQNWVLLLAATAVNSVVPGPGMLLVVGVSAARGFGAGVWVTLGMAIGTLALLGVVWAVMAGTMVLSESGLGLLRVAGVAVLLGLALLLLLLFGTPVDRVAAPGLEAGRFGRRWLGDVGGGLLTALTSPVHLVFMLALLPQFVPFQDVSQAEIALITAALVVMTTTPMLATSALGAGTERLGFGWARHVQRGSGVALLAFFGVAAMAGP